MSIASGCPLAISDEHISTQFPSNIRMSSVTSFLDTSRPDGRMAQFLSHVHLCQIQSEILGIQFFDQELPKDAPEYADWLQKMEITIQTWQDLSTSHSESPAWSTNAANQCRLLLYRPCSRIIVPSESSLHTASALAIQIINSSWDIVQASNLVPTFQYVFSVFQAGMILLYALRNHGPMVRDSDLGEHVRQALDLLILLFVSIFVQPDTVSPFNRFPLCFRMPWRQDGLSLPILVIMSQSSKIPFYEASKQENAQASRLTMSTC